jgi:hypothetical protein
MMTSLDARSQILLKTLIERYIAEGQPVGSRALSRHSGLELSPATVRNVMSDLEEMGFISSPHTSAGRMPTAQGYRFFVDSLLTVQPLEPVPNPGVARPPSARSAAATHQRGLAPAFRSDAFRRRRRDAPARDGADSPDRVHSHFRDADPADHRHHHRGRAEPHL